MDAHSEQELPLIFEGAGDGGTAAEFAASERPRLRAQLADKGALLLRGFACQGQWVDEFERVIRAFSGESLAYSERSSPRSSIKGNIYTSTDYPPDEEIFLHNENSYQSSWPGVLFFCCEQPPQTQGATPLADIRTVYKSIESSVRAEFEARGWMVVRNFHEHFGVGWRQLFNTADRGQVEDYCRSREIRFEWRGDGLRTKAVRRAVHAHPQTGEVVWFNHATFFHNTTLPADVRTGLLGLFGTDELPTNTYYGDGAPIPDDVVAHLRDCYRAAARRFDWRRGDVLVVDNMLAAHGREPFSGPRKIAVAMAENYSPGALAPDRGTGAPATQAALSSTAAQGGGT